MLVVQGVRGGISSGLSWFGQVTGNDSIDSSQLAPSKMRQKSTLFLDTMQFMPQVQKSNHELSPFVRSCRPDLKEATAHGVSKTTFARHVTCNVVLNTSASLYVLLHAASMRCIRYHQLVCVLCTRPETAEMTIVVCRARAHSCWRLRELWRCWGCGRSAAASCAAASHPRLARRGRRRRSA